MSEKEHHPIVDHSIVCCGGHIITTAAKHYPADYNICPTCGADLMDKCDKCGEPIRGSTYEWNRFSAMFGMGAFLLERPILPFGYAATREETLETIGNFCQNPKCKSPYPWSGNISSREFDVLSRQHKQTQEIVQNLRRTVRRWIAVPAFIMTCLIFCFGTGVVCNESKAPKYSQQPSVSDAVDVAKR